MRSWNKLAFVGLLAVAVASAAACSSSPVDHEAKIEQKITYGNNVYISNSGASSYQSEQSLAVVDQNGTRKLIGSYNDANGPGIGWTLSTDASTTAITWTPQGLVPIASGSDMDHMIGDPWIVSDAQTRQKVFLSGLGNVNGSPGNSVLAIAHAINFNGNWSGVWGNGFAHVPTPNCLPPKDIDKPSMDVTDDGTGITITFVCVDSTGPDEIRAIKGTMSMTGIITWGTDALVSPLMEPGYAAPSPIVKGIYIVYANEGIPNHRHVEVAVNVGGDNWAPGAPAIDEDTSDPDFKGMGTNGANPPAPDPNGPYTRITNLVHFSFELDRDSQWPCVILYDVNGRLKFIRSGDGITWSAPWYPVNDTCTLMDGTKCLKQYQGMLRALGLGGWNSYLGIAYYQQDWSLGSPNDRWTAVKGKISNDHGATWTASNDQISKLGGSFVTDGFVPCGQWNSTTPGAPFYFGDYIGLTPLLTHGESVDLLNKRFYAAWADARPSCLSFTNANHQHSVGELFSVP